MRTGNGNYQSGFWRRRYALFVGPVNPWWLKLSADVTNKYLDTLSGKLLLYDGLYSSFRVVKLRPKQPSCDVCSENPKITQLIDYPQFCGAPYSDKVNCYNVVGATHNMWFILFFF